MPCLWGNRAPAAPQQLHYINYINQSVYHQLCDFLKFIPMEGRRKFSITPEISQIHTKWFLCLFSSALHLPPSFVKCFSRSHRWKRNTTKIISVNPPQMGFPGGHHSTLALLCVGTLWVMTPRWLCGHKPPAPGRTKLSTPFQRCSLSRINCSQSEILTEETLHLWAELQTCFSPSVLVPLLCLCHVTSHSSSLLLSTDWIFTAIFWKLQKSNTH